MRRTRILFAMILILATLMTSACELSLPGQVPDSPPAPTQTTDSPASAPAQTDAANDREQFVFTRSNFPRMDGSTSTAPLAEAAACVLLGERREDVAELVIFNRTTQSFRNLANGLCDILIVAEPSADVFDELAAQGFEIEIAPIATDALAFVVNATNPVSSLTTEQIRGIYTGQITNWSEVGGDDIEIVPFQRNAEAGSQVLMEKLVMTGLSLADAPEQKIEIMYGMGDLIEAIKGFDGSANAIGYTVFYYAEDMRMAEGLKIIAVDGVSPTDETIRNSDYPFLNPYYAVIGANEPEDSPARVMYDWLLSSEGQALVKNEGYVSVK